LIFSAIIIIVHHSIPIMIQNSLPNPNTLRDAPVAGIPPGRRRARAARLRSIYTLSFLKDGAGSNASQPVDPLSTLK
jgi:hypothetical protein